MAELAFPAFAVLGLLLVVVPLVTWVCKALLVALRWLAPDVRNAGSTLRYFLLVAPVAVPAVWLVSAALHHAEAEEAALVCLFEHLSQGTCVEPLLIAFGVAVGLGGALLWRRRVSARIVARLRLSHDSVARARVDAACARHPELARVRERIRVVEGHDVRTVGLVRRRIEVGARAARALETDALVGALLHETEHLRSFDPLRYLVVTACQSLNPAGFVLTKEVARWRGGREMLCDEAAVHNGADPCALADALLAIARPSDAADGACAHFGQGGGIDLLRLRVTLLVAYLRSPARCHRVPSGPGLAVAALVLCSLLPHFFGEDLLVELHRGAERVVAGHGGD